MTAVPPITTRVGHYSTDELRFRGKRVFAELLGRTPVGQILVLGITGKQFVAAELETIDDIITAMSSADPRLWPFKITRLASAHGVGAYGLGATLVGSQGGLFGGNRMASAASWLLDLQTRAGNAGATDEEILALLDRDDQGFGVLHRTRDERLEALLRQAEARGRHELPFTRLCRQAIRVARGHRKLEAHVYLGIAALLLDLGFTPHETGMFALVMLFHVALANATEGAEQAPQILQRLPTTSVVYRGVPPRNTPRSMLV